jgi:hypothetical protein
MENTPLWCFRSKSGIVRSIVPKRELMGGFTG